MDIKSLEVGKRYFAKRMNNHFTIIHKVSEKDRPFLGISDNGNLVIWFDSDGKDEWMECGGCWYKLDLSDATDPEWRLPK